MQQSFLARLRGRYQDAVGLDGPPLQRRRSTSCGTVYAAVGEKVRLRVCKPVDDGTSTCIGYIFGTVLSKSTMFIRRAASPWMIQVGSKVMVTGISVLIRSPDHVITKSWRLWVCLSRTCRTVSQWIFGLWCYVKAAVRKRMT